MGPESPRYPVVTSRVSMEHSLRGSQVSKARPHGTPGQAGAPFAFFRHGGFRMRVLVQERGGLDRIQIALKAGMLQRLVRVTRRVVTVHDCPMMTVIGSIAGVECVPFGGRRGVAQDNAHGAAPTALPRQAGAGGITMIDTQPFRAGLTFGGRPSGPWRRGRSEHPLSCLQFGVASRADLHSRSTQSSAESPKKAAK